MATSEREVTRAQQWLRGNSKKLRRFIGKWVAISGKEGVVANSSSLSALMKSDFKGENPEGLLLTRI
ncbi:MAG: hypothetical protein V1708_06160, partial [Candidatus Micrarchaeota archaeon]